MRLFPVVPVSLLALSALASCASFGERAHPLTRAEWRLVQVDYENAYPMDLTPAQQERHWVDFGDGGRLRVGLDCNSGGASWSATGSTGGEGSVAIGPITSTRAFCQPPTFSDEMVADLPQVERYALSASGDRLELFNQRVTFRFAAR